jgi:tRNA A-37 threonylcarbamoyl transferase component Bud32
LPAIPDKRRCEPHSIERRSPSNPDPCRQTPQQPWLREPNRPKITEDDLAQGAILASNTARKVLKIGANMVVKFGPEVNLTEADAIMYIRDNTTIPVPRIFDAFKKDGKNYIVMEYVQGVLLKDIWLNISKEEKSVIVFELRNFICQLRRLSVPKDVLIGSVTGGPAIDRRQFGSVSGGPFRSEHDFNEWQLAQLHPEVPESRRDMYVDMHTTGHQIFFTHGDLGPHNVIVKDGHVGAIIDWEFSGWYPEHWDYCKSASFLGSTEEDYQACKKMYEKQYQAESWLDMWFGREILHGGF